MRILASQLREDLVLMVEAIEEAKVPAWMLKKVRNPKTGNVVQVRSLPPKEQERYRPKKMPRAIKHKVHHQLTGKASPEHIQKLEKKHGLIKTALKKAWHTVAEPVESGWKLATDKKYRKKVVKRIVGAFKTEAKETKQMVGTFRSMLKGEKVSPKAKQAAVNQLMDVAKAVAIGAMYAHVAAGGVAQLLAVVASPAEEIAGVLIDKPLRMATNKLFGVEHGILPSAFYGEAEEVEVSDQEVLEKVVNMLMDELHKIPLDPTADDDGADDTEEV